MAGGKLISTGVEFPDATTQTSATNTSASTTELDILDGATLTTAELNLMDGVTATTAELNYVDGVTSNIQTQFNNISVDPTMGGDLSGTASNAQIVANAVGNTEMANDAIGVAELSATGTASSSTYLRGDNSWAAVAAAGADTSLSNLSATGEKRVCHVWVHFKGTGTVAIQDSYNVSSVTDNGSGDYTVNFSITMANDNFSWSIGGTYPGTVTAHRPYFVGAWSSTTHSQTLSTTHIRCAAGINYQPGVHSASLYDAELVAVSIFGD